MTSAFKNGAPLIADFETLLWIGHVQESIQASGCLVVRVVAVVLIIVRKFVRQVLADVLQGLDDDRWQIVIRTKLYQTLRIARPLPAS